MKIIKSNILKESNGLIVQGCNASGAFGSGLAGQIRKQFPKVYDKFKLMPTGEASLGKLQIIHIENDLYIANGFTQLNYGNDGKRYASTLAIEHVLAATFQWCHLYDLPLKTVKIGCGLGGLDWEADVEPIFIEMMKNYPSVDVTIFEI